MTDTQLIGYCEIHCETERALFSIEHVNRMLTLAGQPKLPPYVTGFTSAHEEMAELCKLARERIFAKSSQCGDCGGTREVGGLPCPVCCPTDDGPTDVGGGIPISEFAAMSSENAAIVDQLRKGLDDGSISLCACMGPIGDDPYCPCDMKRRGLVATNPWTPEKIAELHRVLDKYKPRRPDDGPENEAPTAAQ